MKDNDNLIHPDCLEPEAGFNRCLVELVDQAREAGMSDREIVDALNARSESVAEDVFEEQAA